MAAFYCSFCMHIKMQGSFEMLHSRPSHLEIPSSWPCSNSFLLGQTGWWLSFGPTIGLRFRRLDSDWEWVMGSSAGQARIGPRWMVLQQPQAWSRPERRILQSGRAWVQSASVGLHLCSALGRVYKFVVQLPQRKRGIFIVNTALLIATIPREVVFCLILHFLRAYIFAFLKFAEQLQSGTKSYLPLFFFFVPL